MGFKENVKKTFIGRYGISLLHCVECFIVPKLVTDEKAVKSFYRRKTGKELDLDFPVSFCEKLNWYKLKGHLSLMTQCADKVAVREYVASKGYADSLNTVYGVYDRVKDIKLDELPEQFVLKAAHGSHMNIIVKDKKDLNWFREKLMMRSWLHQDIYWCGREWVYKDIPKRMIAEAYLEDESGELRDYKFFCFNGKPTYLQMDCGRYANEHIRNYYDMKLCRLSITDHETVSKDIGVPLEKRYFEEMYEMAKTLSEPFQFVRTDFYLVNGKVYFGEMTFFDGGGYSGFVNEKDDYMFGEHWTVTE